MCQFPGGTRPSCPDPRARVPAGSCVQSFVRHGFHFDTGLHYIGGLGSGEPLQAPFHALGLDYRYEICRLSDHKLCLRAETTQLFIDANGELPPYAPDYYVEWKKRFAVACPK